MNVIAAIASYPIGRSERAPRGDVDQSDRRRDDHGAEHRLGQIGERSS
jgi:hypothetical protein